MINRNFESFYQLIKEESGIRGLKEILAHHKEKYGNKFEIWLHQDLDGVTSALAMIAYLNQYGMELRDAHIIQYGGLEYAIKKAQPDSLAVLVDFAHFKSNFKIATDHHTSQSGTSDVRHAKPSRSNVQTISGEISPRPLFPEGDLELISTVDSANFLKYGLDPTDISNSVFQREGSLTADENRFLMGLVVNRLLLAFKNKRITVKSLDGKRQHTNKNFLECLTLDSTTSLYSMYVNIKHYMKNAVAPKWTGKGHIMQNLASTEELEANVAKYRKTREMGAKGVEYDEDYGIIYQYGIGYVIPTGSYDRYTPFANFRDSNFLCTVYPMGLIQVSCNPFKKKTLEKVDLGQITKQVLGNNKNKLEKIFIPLADFKRINEKEIEDRVKAFGEDYEAIGFSFEDLFNNYKNDVLVSPKEKINLGDSKDPRVQSIKKCFSMQFNEWSYNQKVEMGKYRISFLKIVETNSGGHPSITNISGWDYLAARRDLLKLYYETEDYTVVIQKIAKEFLDILKKKVDDALGKSTTVVDSSEKVEDAIELLGIIGED